MVEEEEDWYDVLEVEVGTSIQEVGKKYRKLALKHHPDRGGDGTLYDIGHHLSNVWFSQSIPAHYKSL